MRRLVVAAVLLLLVIAGGGFVYLNATTPYRTLPTVKVGAAQAAAAQKKVDALRNSGGSRSGQPARVTQSFSDSELSSLANQEVQNQSLPLDNLVLHATAEGRIEGLGTAHWAGQSLPLFLVATVQVAGTGQLQLTIVESKLGRLNVPAALAGQINSAVRQSVNLGETLKLTDVSINVTQGMVTVSGVPTPA